MSYRTKLQHNFHEFSARERRRYLWFDRLFLPRAQKFFFEGCLEIPGQMYWQERQTLYNTILNYQPLSCFEIGTYTGGGSSFFLASAFAKLGRGKVFSLESEKSLFEHAKQMYAHHLPYLLPYVEFLYGASPDAFIPSIPKDVGCFFLDGSDNGEETAAQYAFFKRFLKPGTIMMAHDWESAKQNILRPIIENDPGWKLVSKLGLPESVGFVVYQYSRSK